MIKNRTMPHGRRGALGHIEPGILTEDTVHKIIAGAGDLELNLSLLCGVQEKTGTDTLHRESEIPYSERWTAEALREHGFSFVYEPLGIKVTGENGERDSSYLPDFLINREVDGKRFIVIEPHGKKSFTAESIRKYARFYSANKKIIHFVVITDMTAEELDQLKVEAGIPGIEIADKVIHTPKSKGQNHLKEDREAFIKPLSEYLSGLASRMHQQFWLETERTDDGPRARRFSL